MKNGKDDLTVTFGIADPKDCTDQEIIILIGIFHWVESKIVGSCELGGSGSEHYYQEKIGELLEDFTSVRSAYTAERMKRLGVVWEKA